MRLALIIGGIAIACLGVLAAVELGSDEDGDSAETESLASPPETADPLPRLPRGWTRTANGAGGFALGVPPGWSAKEAGARTTLRAPGSAVVVRITADRTDEALDAELEEFAARIAERLAGGGVAEPVAPAPKPVSPAPKPGEGGYESAAVVFDRVGPPRGRGQRLEVVVVRRSQLAAYPVLIASDESVKPAQLDPIVNRLIGSLRGRPVQ